MLRRTRASDLGDCVVNPHQADGLAIQEPFRWLITPPEKLVRDRLRAVRSRPSSGRCSVWGGCERGTGCEAFFIDHGCGPDGNPFDWPSYVFPASGHPSGKPDGHAGSWPFTRGWWTWVAGSGVERSHPSLRSCRRRRSEASPGCIRRSGTAGRRRCVPGSPHLSTGTCACVNRAPGLIHPAHRPDPVSRRARVQPR